MLWTFPLVFLFAYSNSLPLENTHQQLQQQVNLENIGGPDATAQQHVIETPKSDEHEDDRPPASNCDIPSRSQRRKHEQKNPDGTVLRSAQRQVVETRHPVHSESKFVQTEQEPESAKPKNRPPASNCDIPSRSQRRKQEQHRVSHETVASKEVEDKPKSFHRDPVLQNKYPWVKFGFPEKKNDMENEDPSEIPRATNCDIPSRRGNQRGSNSANPCGQKGNKEINPVEE